MIKLTQCICPHICLYIKNALVSQRRINQSNPTYKCVALIYLSTSAWSLRTVLWPGLREQILIIWWVCGDLDRSKKNLWYIILYFFNCLVFCKNIVLKKFLSIMFSLISFCIFQGFCLYFAIIIFSSFLFRILTKEYSHNSHNNGVERSV